MVVIFRVSIEAQVICSRRVRIPISSIALSYFTCLYGEELTVVQGGKLEKLGWLLLRFVGFLCCQRVDTLDWLGDSFALLWVNIALQVEVMFIVLG